MRTAGEWWRSPGKLDWAILIRLSLAFVFILEGYQKLVFPEILGLVGSPRSGFPMPR